jgi:putative solute:sodium symporter small subunit
MNDKDKNIEPNYHSPEVQIALKRYWRNNLRLISVLLFIWAFASLGCGVLFADWLNQFQLPFTGFPLGFWFAQQGSIMIFVLCIFLYCLFMERLDRQHHRLLESLKSDTDDSNQGMQ